MNVNDYILPELAKNHLKTDMKIIIIVIIIQFAMLCWMAKGNNYEDRL